MLDRLGSSAGRSRRARMLEDGRWQVAETKCQDQFGMFGATAASRSHRDYRFGRGRPYLASPGKQWVLRRPLPPHWFTCRSSPGSSPRRDRSRSDRRRCWDSTSTSVRMSLRWTGTSATAHQTRRTVPAGPTTAMSTRAGITCALDTSATSTPNPHASPSPHGATWFAQSRVGGGAWQNVGSVQGTTGQLPLAIHSAHTVLVR